MLSLEEELLYKTESQTYKDIVACCAVVGIKGLTTKEGLKKAYKEQAKKLHPDFNKSNNANAEFNKLNVIYKFLDQHFDNCKVVVEYVEARQANLLLKIIENDKRIAENNKKIAENRKVIDYNKKVIIDSRRMLADENRKIIIVFIIGSVFWLFFSIWMMSE